MSRINLVVLAVAVLLVAASANAQIQVVATTFDPPGTVDGVRVGTLAIAAGTDVTAGFALQDAGVPNSSFSSWSASGEFSLATSPTEAVAELTQSTSSPFINTQTTSTSSRAAVELLYTSAIPLDFDVTMIVPADSAGSCSRQWGSVTVIGQTTFSTDTTSANCTQDPFTFPPVVTCSQTLAATVGPTGLRIQLVGETWSSGGLDHLDLPTAPPRVAPARPPPEPALPF